MPPEGGNLMAYRTKFEKDLRKYVKGFGGAINAHAHLDRAGTPDKSYLEHVGKDPMEAVLDTLGVKQNLTGDLHTGLAYTPKDLRRRMIKMLKVMAEDYDTRQVWSLIDTTADIGRRAFDIALELKEQYKDMIDFRVGSYPTFGFKDSDPARWKVFEDASKDADFLGALPERDERKGHVGYKEHLRRILCLAADLYKPVDVHADQKNDPREHGTEELVHAMYCIPPAKRLKDGKPLVWAVHVISPAGYTERRHRDLLDGMYEFNIGVKCCPIAARTMLQNRKIRAPTHNSIARILEIAERGIPLMFGSDNIEDVFVTTGTPDMYREVISASEEVRYQTHPEMWAKLLAGRELNEMDMHNIRKAICRPG